MSDEEETREIPRMYRSMYAENGRPKVGTENNMLGARLPRPGGRDDIAPDGDGLVHPGRGMSVFRSVEEMPAFLVPPGAVPLGAQRRLGLRSGKGKEGLVLWRIGAGAFRTAPVAADLLLRADDPNKAHGEIEPQRSMRVDAYQAALAATRDDWSAV